MTFSTQNLILVATYINEQQSWKQYKAILLDIAEPFKLQVVLYECRLSSVARLTAKILHCSETVWHVTSELPVLSDKPLIKLLTDADVSLTADR